MKHVQDPPQPPSERRPDLAIPPELERIVLRTLAKDPDERYQSAQEMLDALPASDDLPGGYTSQSLTPAPRATAPVRPVKRRRGAAIVAAVALAALFAGWIVLRQRTGPPPVSPPTVVAATDLQVAHPQLPDVGPAPDRTRSLVTLEVQARPGRAVIRVNGKQVGTGSAMTGVPPNSTAIIEVSAPGYRPHREELRAVKDMVVPIRLRRLPRGPRPPPKQNKAGGDLQGNPYR
jgi:serine/threonine-protein kinase